MPIQFPDFPMLTREQVSPIPGIQAGQELMQKNMMFPQQIQQAMLTNQLNRYKVQQEMARAPYYPGLAKAELLKAEAEPKEILARTGYYGAEAGKLGKETQWYDKEAQARIGLQQATAAMQGTEAQKNALILKYIKEGMIPSSASQKNPSINPQPSVYGIETPAPTRQDLVNKMAFGIDTFTPRMENAKKQQQDQYDSFQKEITSSIKEANAANDMNQAISIFNNAMNQSTYKGSRFGHLPSSGVGSMLIPGNLSPEQEADRSATQMLPAAIETLKNAMGSARFSNLDMNMATKMKFDRTMNYETRKTQTAWINAVNDRIKEKAKFYSVLGNPSSGASKTKADMLFQEYQNNFPLINESGDAVLIDNLGNWPLYTTPKALASIQQTGSYIPSKSEQETFMMKVPDGKGGFIIAPIKKGSVESAMRKGALPL